MKFLIILSILILSCNIVHGESEQRLVSVGYTTLFLNNHRGTLLEGSAWILLDKKTGKEFLIVKTDKSISVTELSSSNVSKKE